MSSREVSVASTTDGIRSFSAELWDQIKLAAPICVGFLANRYVTAVSLAMAGKIGPETLAGVSLAVSLANVSGYSVLVGLTGAVQTLAGQAFGAGNFEEVSLSLQRCFLVCCLALIPIVSLWLSSYTLLLSIGMEEAVSKIAFEYLVLLLPGVCCYMVTQCVQNWLAAQRVTRPGGYGGLLVAALYLPLCWGFVHGLGWGFRGAAISTSLANSFVMMWLLFSALRHVRTTHRSCWQGFSQKAFQNWGPFLKLALPSSVMISEWWASEIIVLSAGLLPSPEVSLASVSLMSNTVSFCFMPPLCFGIAANTRVSNELGSGRPRAAARASIAAITLGIGVVCSCGAILYGLRHQWLSVFSKDDAILWKRCLYLL